MRKLKAGITAGLLLVALTTVAADEEVVNPAMAEATPMYDPKGVVDVVVQGVAGSNTAEQVVTGSYDDALNPYPYNETSLSVMPGYTGNEVFCKLKDPPGNDSHAITCKAKDDYGADELVVELTVFFPAEGQHDYKITWENDRMDVKWDGRILLPAEATNGEAQLHVYSRAPFPDALDIPPPHTQVPLKDPTTGGGHWEVAKNGVANHAIVKDTAGDHGEVNKSKTFEVTAIASGADKNLSGNTMYHTVYTSLEVNLSESVTVENASGGTFETKTNFWEVYGWTLNVSVVEVTEEE